MTKSPAAWDSGYIRLDLTDPAHPQSTGRAWSSVPSERGVL
jgi:hypothetical protein